jgi:hypothetical protein
MKKIRSSSHAYLRKGIIALLLSGVFCIEAHLSAMPENDGPKSKQGKKPGSSLPVSGKTNTRICQTKSCCELKSVRPVKTVTNIP